MHCGNAYTFTDNTLNRIELSLQQIVVHQLMIRWHLKMKHNHLPFRKQKVVNSLFHPPYQAIMIFLSQKLTQLIHHR